MAFSQPPRDSGLSYHPTSSGPSTRRVSSLYLQSQCDPLTHDHAHRPQNASPPLPHSFPLLSNCLESVPAHLSPQPPAAVTHGLPSLSAALSPGEAHGLLVKGMKRQEGVVVLGLAFGVGALVQSAALLLPSWVTLDT